MTAEDYNTRVPRRNRSSPRRQRVPRVRGDLTFTRMCAYYIRVAIRNRYKYVQCVRTRFSRTAVRRRDFYYNNFFFSSRFLFSIAAAPKGSRAGRCRPGAKTKEMCAAASRANRSPIVLHSSRPNRIHSVRPYVAAAGRQAGR